MKRADGYQQGANTGISLPKGLCHFTFRRPYPVECLPNEMGSLFHRGEAYSFGICENQKKPKALRPLCLCGE
jgi:hypothetical protein